LLYFIIKDHPFSDGNKRIGSLLFLLYLIKAKIDLKNKLWGTEFWTNGYFMSTVGKHRDEKKLRNYVKNKGADRPSYKAFHQKQLKLF
ncbi:MAG: Fic family protein, partial [Rickettsia endosymbiont of Ixodes persulcatus]|nr:Fic family protein [Rickettsia endosymbiont of Ixodes persulcatus]